MPGLKRVVDFLGIGSPIQNGNTVTLGGGGYVSGVLRLEFYPDILNQGDPNEPRLSNTIQYWDRFYCECIPRNCLRERLCQVE